MSGAGKTTLLDVLASRKNSGFMEGEVLLNGHAKEEDSFSRITSYVGMCAVTIVGVGWGLGVGGWLVNMVVLGIDDVLYTCEYVPLVLYLFTFVRI